MCGISVIVTKNKDYHDKIEAMTDLVKHRGPDACGIYQSGKISMGHRRLKIIDLSDEANQPMRKDGVVIVHNGEIYNYKELREELRVAGVTFETDSDTEVLLQLYKHAHTIPEMLSRLHGMFAFVIYNENTKELVAARDRFGIKPLYYTKIDGGVAFASEIKQFSALPNWKPNINQYMADQFLNSGLIDHEKGLTMFRDVFLFPPGTFIQMYVGYIGWTCEVSPRVWYDLSKEILCVSPDSTYLTAQWLLKCSVESHLQSDVPVGSCLSGGIDSTAIVCLVNRIRKTGKQVTVTNRTHIPEIDEGKWVDIVEQYCENLERYDVYPDGGKIFTDLNKLIYHQDSPVPTSSMYAQWCVFDEAKNHVKVMLDGQGADEIFGGYHMYFGVRFANLLKGGHLYTLLNEMKAAQKIPGYDKQFVMKCAAGNFSKYNSIREYSIAQLTRTSLPALLHWEDRNSMASSIEARVPYLDHTLVERMVALPDEKKVSNGVTKVILREAMKDIIPDDIVNRKDKIGFFTPEEYWFNQNQHAFSTEYRTARKYLPSAMQARCDNILHKKTKYTSELWRAITFGKFIEVFEVET